MMTNLQMIQTLTDYIEEHLDEPLTLADLAEQVGYSKYHLSRLFVHVTGQSLHSYIQRRRLTEAARLLVQTQQPILQIALTAGYETQRSFSRAFKAAFHLSPHQYRLRGAFYPLQLPFAAQANDGRARDKRMIGVRMIVCGAIRLAGYQGSTRWGFGVIGRLWQRLGTSKQQLSPRLDPDFLIGLNDYSAWALEGEHQPAFTYYAAAEVADIEGLPAGMVTRELPPSRYVVFTLRGRNQDSMQPLVEYVYQQWFPQTTLQYNENARYDFARYGESVDAEGLSTIEFWVPVL